MPTLVDSLKDRDLGHLHIVAGCWGIELDAPDARAGLQQLAPALLDVELIHQGVAGLPAGAREALDDLYQNEGRLPWQLFTRRYGAVREMGAGRRDRERPYLKNPSPAEMLWYRGLVAREFFDTPTGVQEFAYIPADLLPLLPVPRDMQPAPLGRPALPAERQFPIPAGDAILDDACTLLAALRLGLPVESLFFPTTGPASHGDAETQDLPGGGRLSPGPLKQLLAAASLLDENGLPRPEPTRAFLEASRGEALAWLARAWLDSPDYNDFRLMPGLLFEGEWENDPRRARRAVIDFLSTLPGEGQGEEEGGRKAHPYWHIDSFIAAIREKHPDFQRPAGDYDSWFIRDARRGQFLRGFAHWDEVDGAFIRFLLTGMLHTLGILDLAAPAEGAPPTAFRLSGWASALLRGEAPTGLRNEDEPVIARSDGRLSLSRYAPRAVRYQVARFCAWEGEKEGSYRYRITPASLARARAQGLTAAHLIALLTRHARAVPPNLRAALQRWEGQGTEARLEQALVLRVTSPELLQKLRSSRAARFLGEPLGPTAVIVKPGAGQKVLDALAEMGILGEDILTASMELPVSSPEGRRKGL